LRKRYGRLDEPFVFFVDRCLGGKVVPDALRQALADKEELKVHHEHFEADAEDTEWLVEVGKRGWVVISQDQRIIRNPLEQRTLLAANVAFFGIGQANLGGQETGRALVEALPVIRRALRRFKCPIIATVTLKGEVVVKWDEGQRRSPPIRLQLGRRYRK
jgi:hypothetical protein